MLKNKIMKHYILSDSDFRDIDLCHLVNPTKIGLESVKSKSMTIDQINKAESIIWFSAKYGCEIKLKKHYEKI